MSKVRLATVWLDGCSGCHMSLLDMDERLVEIADKVEIVYSPLVDNKEFPQEVDITLVEGAIGNVEDEEKIKMIRQRTKTLVSLGDCAVTGNVPSMRNTCGAKAVLERVYLENVTLQPQIPSESVPALRSRVCPVREVVKVDVFVPGCPPSADTIHALLVGLLSGSVPDISLLSRFGA
ncbi:MAG: NADP oxidoreductase [Acidobacteria bacterium]|nr:MAG: NADP oxidoreductase [Acidobacteriota bacterium]